MNIFPETWKIVRVLHIPKIFKVEGIKDLRPISILPIIKVLERVVYSQLTIPIFGKNKNILSGVQTGFHKGRSTNTAPAHVIDDLITATDTGEASTRVLLDFSRAFDCISAIMV